MCQDVKQVNNPSSNQDEIFYRSSFERLTSLVLKNPKMSGINMDFLRKIGRWCRNLTSFTLTLYYRYTANVFWCSIHCTLETVHLHF